MCFAASDILLLVFVADSSTDLTVDHTKRDSSTIYSRTDSGKVSSYLFLLMADVLGPVAVK